MCTVVFHNMYLYIQLFHRILVPWQVGLLFILLWISFMAEKCCSSRNTSHEDHCDTKFLKASPTESEILQNPTSEDGCWSNGEEYCLKYMEKDLSEKECLEMNCVILCSQKKCLKECPSAYTNYSGYCRPHFCASKRVANVVSNLKYLRGCRVIEGSLQIVLMRDVGDNSAQMWSEWSFPELKEITDFLLIYDISGLQSLGQLFPNLAVIRGMTLHQDYALIIYNAKDLRKIDLYSLTSIPHGSVRIQNNFNLCYLNTIVWSLIVHDASGNVFRNNEDDRCSDCCPSSHPHDDFNGRIIRGSWSKENYQYECKNDSCKNVSGCTSDGECCGEQCLGGCFRENGTLICHACRHYIDNKNCTSKCLGTGKKYVYRGYRCVSEAECCEMGFILYTSDDGSKNECLPVCPAGYEKQHREVRSFCQRCEGPCQKSCLSQFVNSVAKARLFKGCTIINGSLIISISGGNNIAKELNDSLGMIEEVTEYIWIFDSHPLLTLEFLRNLKIIGGNRLYNSKYAMYVHSNDNLEDIWSWKEHPNVTIEEKNAMVLFHSNPKLCYHKIEELLKNIGQNITDDINMRLTNGNRIACSEQKQEISLKAFNEKGVLGISFSIVSIDDDDRKLTGYFVYYKESKEKNLVYMSGRDACNDDWKQKYIDISTSQIYVSTKLVHLKPDTQYAVYVKTDTVGDANISAISDIRYIKTLPYNPSSPQNLEYEVGTSWIFLRWDEPSSPNGKIMDYVITVKPQKWERMNCSDISGKISTGEQEQFEQAIPSNGENWRGSNSSQLNLLNAKCCPCQLEDRNIDQKHSIDFEDSLLSFVFISKSPQQQQQQQQQQPFDHSRIKRETGIQVSNYKGLPAGWQAKYGNYSSAAETPVPFDSTAEINRWRTTNLTINITGLAHFSSYQIEVKACQEPKTNCSDGNYMCVLCSLYPERKIVTTHKRADINIVSGLTTRSVNTSTLIVQWSDFPDPGEQIHGYMLNISLYQQNTAISWTPTLLRNCFNSDEIRENNTIVLDISSLKSELYNITVEPFGRNGFAFDTAPAVASFKKGDLNEMSNSSKVWITLVILIAMIPVGYATFKVISRQEIPKQTENPFYTSDLGAASGILDMYGIPGDKIFDYTDVRLEDSCILGKGKFGVVVKGYLTNDLRPVAVKKVTDYRYLDRANILKEAKLMLKLKCHHLIEAYGVMVGPNSTYLVMELMDRADLLSYLRSLNAQNNIFTVMKVDVVCAMAVQIADGMAYLASRKIVHRDLAARNCLIDGHLSIKISDFGMARMTDKDYYKIRDSKYIPVRWMAPEFLTSYKFTNKSDVWSYGIVLWEILTGGARPYQDMHDHKDVCDWVSRGNTLEAYLPHDTPSFLTEVILSCWRFLANQRPHFPQVIGQLLPQASPIFQQKFRMVAFYHSPEGEEYKRILESLKESECSNELTSPLTTFSHSPFSSSSSSSSTYSQDVPLPKLPMVPGIQTGFRWQPAFSASQPCLAQIHSPPSALT